MDGRDDGAPMDLRWKRYLTGSHHVDSRVDGCTMASLADVFSS